jgi:DNA polymerase-3 subunit epsilon
MFSYPSSTGTYSHTHRGFAVIDLETTGFDARGRDRIVEVAIVRVDALGHKLGIYETLVNPLRPPGATAVHGITDAMVRDAPPFSEVASSVLAWLDGVVVVAHNALFEDAFLSAEFRRAGVRVPRLPALDTLPLAQKFVPTPNHRLSTVCDWAGVELIDAHTALGDALAASALLPQLLRVAGPVRWHTTMPRLRKSVSGGYCPRSAQVVTP